MEKKLDPEFKAKWTRALRSGEYTQGRYAMLNKATGGHCCLAVACRVAGCSTEEIRESGYDSEKLPAILRGGFSNDVTAKLIHQNDTYGKSFSEIADYIEKNL